MIVDALDARGRRYLEVPGRMPWRVTGEFSEVCVDCGVRIEPEARYFQRNEPDDGHQNGLEGLLLALTYDAVCGPCGDRILREDAT